MKDGINKGFICTKFSWWSDRKGCDTDSQSRGGRSFGSLLVDTNIDLVHHLTDKQLGAGVFGDATQIGLNGRKYLVEPQRFESSFQSLFCSPFDLESRDDDTGACERCVASSCNCIGKQTIQTTTRFPVDQLIQSNGADIICHLASSWFDYKHLVSAV